MKYFLMQKRPTKRAPDAGDSAHIPSLFHALAFSWLDGFAVPAPAQVTQTVGLLVIVFIFFLNSFELYFYKGILEVSAPNGLRYLRWGRDGEAVQPEK